MITWDGIKIADKGFLINLEERKDRLEESILEFNRNNIIGVERFEAVKITKDSENGWVIRGCTHSHMNILKTQVENNWEKVIIFEDDFFLDVCHPDKNIVTQDMIEQISKEEFDVLFLGATLLSESEYVNEYLIRPNKFVQTTCYISNLKFAKFVTNHFNYLDENSVVYGEAIDSYYSVLSERNHWRINKYSNAGKEIINNDLKIYFTYPIIFNQRNSFSNIENRMSLYSHYNKLRNTMYYPKK